MKFTGVLLTSHLSTSPEMLSWLDIPFKKIERPDPQFTPTDTVYPSLQATLKAISQTHKVKETRIGEWVLGTYTLIESDCQAQAAPREGCDTQAMLSKFQGRCYQVHTGLALRDPSSQREITSVVTTRLWMKNYSQVDLDIALARRHPLGESEVHMDQGLIAHVEGCYANVLGLPLCAVANLLETWGLSLDMNIHSLCRTYIGYFCKDYTTRNRFLI